MSNNSGLPLYQRPLADVLTKRLAESRRFIQVLTGARQVGKTTLVHQVLASSDLAHRYVSADEPTLRDRDWLEEQWEVARVLLESGGGGKALLVLDEV